MYNDFAYIYDTLVFDIDYDFYIEQILKKAKDNNINTNRILEFGVGTGNLAKRLCKYSDEYVGIDLSVDMLAIANEKIAKEDNIELLACDINDYHTDDKFSMAVSTLDTINYILDEEDLLKIFQKINNLIEDDGAFIFDINSENKLIDILGNNTYVYEYENIFYTWQNFYDEDEQIVDFLLDFFIEENGVYHRITEEQSEKIYPLEKILTLLEQAGFSKFQYIDFDTGENIDENSQRILILAIK